MPGNPAEPFENRAMELAATTWKGGDWWEVGGGGTVWDSIAFDPELDLLYVGVGNGSGPDASHNATRGTAAAAPPPRCSAWSVPLWSA